MGLAFARRGGGDRGAALIEFALVGPILVLLALGILEYGNAFRQANAVEQAVGQATRAASVQANSRWADYEALQVLRSSTAPLQGIEIEWVSIFRVETSNTSGTVPEQCRSRSVSNLCNYYTGAQLESLSLAQFPGTNSSPSCGAGLDARFCPLTQRHRTTEPPTVIGMHVAVTYSPVTGIIPGTTLTMERSAIYQVEPCARGLLSC